jgi:hypothetical protein
MTPTFKKAMEKAAERISQDWANDRVNGGIKTVAKLGAQWAAEYLKEQFIQVEKDAIDNACDRCKEENQSLRELLEDMHGAIKMQKLVWENLFEKGNVNWGATFGINFDLMNRTLIALDKALAKYDAMKLKEEVEND